MDKDNLEIILEDIREKFDLVLEGHEALRGDIRETRQEFNEKLDLVNFKVDTLHQRVENVREELVEKIDNVEAGLSEKIDAVAEDLAAHRADTESHRKGYKVSDG
jgi:chromosome segregation ATPase